MHYRRVAGIIVDPPGRRRLAKKPASSRSHTAVDDISAVLFNPASIPFRQVEPRQFVRIRSESELLGKAVGRHIGVQRCPICLFCDAL